MFQKFITGIVTALFITLGLIPNASAAQSKWQFMETPGLEYGVHQGELSYSMLPLESTVNGVDHFLELQYGIFPGWELDSTIESNSSSVIGHLQIKHDLIRADQLILTGTGKIDFGEGAYWNPYNNQRSTYQYLIPKVKLLFAQQVNPQMIFYTNAQLTHKREMDFDLDLEQGLKYQIHPEHQIKGRILTRIISTDQIKFNIKAEYKASLTERVDYYLRLDKTVGEANLFYSNNLTIRPTDKTEITGTLAYNTEPLYTNTLLLSAEKEIDEDLKVHATFNKTLRKYGDYGLRAGFRIDL